MGVRIARLRGVFLSESLSELAANLRSLPCARYGKFFRRRIAKARFFNAMAGSAFSLLEIFGGGVCCGSAYRAFEGRLFK